MRPRSAVPLVLTLCLVAPASLAGQEAAKPDKKALIQEALSAGVPGITDQATVLDWDGNILREGTNGWSCMPTPPGVTGTSPMCMDAQWMAFAGAWQAKRPVETTAVGVAYMLTGDAGASNTDPFAEAPTADNQWIKAGPHLMVIVPDAADLESLSTDYESGGPWVMWKGTQYVHLMVPLP